MHFLGVGHQHLLRHPGYFEPVTVAFVPAAFIIYLQDVHSRLDLAILGVGGQCAPQTRAELVRQLNQLSQDTSLRSLTDFYTADWLTSQPSSDLLFLYSTLSSTFLYTAFSTIYHHFVYTMS